MGPVVFMAVLAPWAASAEHSVHGEKRVGDRGQVALTWKGGRGPEWGGPGAIRGSHGWGGSQEAGVPLALCTPRRAGWKRIPEFRSRGAPYHRGVVRCL